jgi:hypothetical protein
MGEVEKKGTTREEPTTAAGSKSKPNRRDAGGSCASSMAAEMIPGGIEEIAPPVPFAPGWGFGIVHCGEITPPDLLELGIGSVRCEAPGLAAGSLELTEPLALPTVRRETRDERLSRMEYKSSTNVPLYFELFSMARL